MLVFVLTCRLYDKASIRGVAFSERVLSNAPEFDITFFTCLPGKYSGNIDRESEMKRWRWDKRLRKDWRFSRKKGQTALVLLVAR